MDNIQCTSKNQPRESLIGWMAHSLAIAAYTFSLVIILRDYASVEWKIYRFVYVPMGIYEFIALSAFLFITGIAVPRRIQSPSSLVLIFVLILIVIPAGVCLLAMDMAGTTECYQLLAAIGLSFAGACWLNRASPNELKAVLREPHKSLVPVMAGVNALLLAYLVYRFGSIMSFASLDSLYEQREKGAANNFFDGYAQVYSQYVFSTGLIAFGLYRKNFYLVIFGFFGSIINFMITAEKSGFLYPFFIIGLFFMINSRIELFKKSYLIMIAFAAILIFATKLYIKNSIAEFLAWYIGIRTIMTPGSFIVQYMDFFSHRGYTHFSHIRGIGSVIGTPSQYANDGRWPALGLIVGEDHFGFLRLNANASFVASDGIASFGIIGIPVVFFLVALYLRVLDKSAHGIGGVALVILLPFTLTLSNGSIFTLLTSFGGIFWVIIMRFVFVEGQASSAMKATALEGDLSGPVAKSG